MLGGILGSGSSPNGQIFQLTSECNIRVKLAGTWSKKGDLERAKQHFDLKTAGLEPPEKGKPLPIPEAYLTTKQNSSGSVHISDGHCRFKDYSGCSYYDLSPNYWSEIEIIVQGREAIRLISPEGSLIFNPV